MSDSCNPVDSNPPGSSVHGILQARILQWVAIPFSRGSSQPRNGTQVSCLASRFFTDLPAELQGKIPIISSASQTETVSPLKTNSSSLFPLLCPSSPPSYFLSLWSWVLLGPNKWNHTVFVLWLAFFTEHTVFKVHLCCDMSGVPSFLKPINITGVLTWQNKKLATQCQFPKCFWKGPGLCNAHPATTGPQGQCRVCCVAASQHSASCMASHAYSSFLETTHVPPCTPPSSLLFSPSGIFLKTITINGAISKLGES